MPPSLSSYPQGDEIEPALEDALARARVELAVLAARKASAFSSTVTSSRPIDERVTRYLDRSSTFENAAVEEKSADGLAMTLSGQHQAALFLLRHRQQRPRPPHPHAGRRPRLARGRPPRRPRRRGHRRRLRRDLGLPRRPGRRGDDAHRRHPLFAALHLLRHHARGLLRPQFRADVPRRRRGPVARHGAHRPRPDAVDQAAGICAGGRGARRLAGRQCSAATSFRTRSARWSST